MEKISFVKMSGAGNDFIVIDKDANPRFSLTNDIIQKLSDRRNGIGADGVITVENSPETDFAMDYYNADGTQSLCGNGARCAIYFAGKTGRIKNGKTIFLSNSEKYSGEVLGEERVKFLMNSPKDFRLGFEVKAAGHTIENANFVNTGSPHVVININDIKTENGTSYKNLNDVPVFELGRAIRYLDEFKPGGTNVNFISIEDNKVKIRTYERGVENETLACGTGAAAAAIIASAVYNIPPPVVLETFGGDELVVDFKRDSEKTENVSLTGPAEIVYTGEFLLNKFI